ncbi:MAG: hypothetical protein LBU90_02350 [Bacteroidales bacterium]|jgi:hypothetical protein|nr:hypothetical protein [Bacteroidales bacterium]
MKQLLLGVGIAVSLFSCSSQKYFASNVPPAEITDVQAIEPFSFVSLIEHSDVGVYNDSLTWYAREALLQSLETMRTQLRLSPEVLFVDDEWDRELLLSEVDFLIHAAETAPRRTKKVTPSVAITPLIDSLLTVSGKRFGLLIIQDGFTRSNKNYAGQVATAAVIGVATAVLTGGSAYYLQTPVRRGSTVNVLIVDAQENNVSFYRKSFAEDKNPTDVSVISKQLNALFRDYFF